VADIVDLCLVMSVNPGWGGQRYIPSSTGRLARLREVLPPEVVLEVDGGVSLETVDEARQAGADLLVAGSSVFGTDDPAAAFRALAARL
jgi:ribulose-phosphate 3-epimerase